MFKILARYIGKTVISTTFIVGFIILGILFLLALLTELKNLGEGDYEMWQVFYYVILRIPNSLYQFSPLLILMGTIIGLSTLTTHKELSVMRASGFSIRQIIFSTLFAALLMIVVISIIGELWGPPLSAKASIQKEVARTEGQAVLTDQGLWFHVNNNFIHVEQIMNKGLLAGVTRYEFDSNHHLLATYYADTLVYQDHHWQMQDVVGTFFYPDQTKSFTKDTLPWPLKFNENLLKLGLIDPTEMSLPKLSQFIRYLNNNRLQASEYEFDFWRRIFQPFASILMVFLGIPFVLGAKERASMGWRVVAGLLVGFVFFIIDAFFGELSVVLQIEPMVAALLPLLFFMGMGIFLMRKMVN